MVSSVRTGVVRKTGATGYALEMGGPTGKCRSRELSLEGSVAYVRSASSACVLSKPFSVSLSLLTAVLRMEEDSI